MTNHEYFILTRRDEGSEWTFNDQPFVDYDIRPGDDYVLFGNSQNRVVSVSNIE